MDGKALAERIRGEIAEEVRELGELGLATVLVGDDPASDTYIRLKHKAAGEVGINARDIRLALQTTEEELLQQVEQLNRDDGIDGLLVQLPLPDHIDEARVIRAIDPRKDVDGLHPLNAGHLYLGRPAHVPATPVGVMALLEEYDVPLEGANAVVVGRSDIVGKPASILLLHANATVTTCHSRTADLAARTREADVLVVAVGKAGLIGPDDVKERAARTAALSSIAIVMGPTPPGTGVISPARSETAGSTSPTTPSSERFIPTSITAAPTFTSSGPIRPAFPTATTRTSASRVRAARSAVREWHVVTVAFACRSSIDAGLPTMSLRPTTTAFAPSSGTSYSSRRAITPTGVAGTWAGRPK
jgi:methylenetetrahydrofolate dehydrogenase (NADP+)/methenyltetrahydrofolate cyclohydrolase